MLVNGLCANANYDSKRKVGKDEGEVARSQFIFGVEFHDSVVIGWHVQFHESKPRASKFYNLCRRQMLRAPAWNHLYRVSQV